MFRWKPEAAAIQPAIIYISGGAGQQTAAQFTAPIPNPESRTFRVYHKLRKPPGYTRVVSMRFSSPPPSSPHPFFPPLLNSSSAAWPETRFPMFIATCQQTFVITFGFRWQIFTDPLIAAIIYSRWRWNENETFPPLFIYLHSARFILFIFFLFFWSCDCISRNLFSKFSKWSNSFGNLSRHVRTFNFDFFIWVSIARWTHYGYVSSNKIWSLFTSSVVILECFVENIFRGQRVEISIEFLETF